VGTIIVNAATEPRLPAAALKAAAAGELDTAELAAGLTAAGITATPEMLEGLATQAAEHAIRVLDEADCRAQLAATGLPMLSLPRLVDGGDLGGVYELADRLTAQGVT
jgi:hypothetical protein